MAGIWARWWRRDQDEIKSSDGASVRRSMNTSREQSLAPPGPWHPLGYVDREVARRYVDSSQRLLMVGLSSSAPALRYARMGYRVTGMDTDEDRVRSATQAALRSGLLRACCFQVMPQDYRALPINRFDLVVSLDSMANESVDGSLAWLKRVIKPSGSMILVQRLSADNGDDQEAHAGTPMQRSVTEADVLSVPGDEGILNETSLDRVRETFESVQVQRFEVHERLGQLFPQSRAPQRTRVREVEKRLARICPPLERLAGTAVIICQ